MILELYIENFALVDVLRVNFEEGLNILTGETGSGKSIIIDALNLVLGERFDKSYIRKGRNKGLVEATFYIKNNKVKELLLEYGMDLSLDENMIITREMYADGKSISRINGRNVKLSFLKNLGTLLIDIHGQHENQVLFHTEKHLEFLDLYGENKLENAKNEYIKTYKTYLSLKKELENLTENKDERQIQREMDLLKFQIKEIEDANLKIEEYDELLKEREVYRNSEKIYSNLNNAYLHLYSSNINGFDSISKALKELKDLSAFDPKLEEMHLSVEEIMYRLQDISKDIRDYKENIDFCPQALDDVEIRIDSINNLRRKYGNTVEDIFEYKEKMNLRLEEIINRDEKVIELKEKIEKIRNNLEEKSKKITLKRKEIANNFEKQICSELDTLNMKNINFKVYFEEKEEFSLTGKDDVEFMISFNIGEDLKSISKTASGGEMSRFMLAFKRILSDVDEIETLVFDEIDTGISGIAAQIVGEKLKVIANKKQLICITHLPQIAVNADVHFHIEKIIEQNRAYTKIVKLSEEDKIKEIARLIAGLNITEKTIEHAKEILEITKNKGI